MHRSLLPIEILGMLNQIKRTRNIIKPKRIPFNKKLTQIYISLENVRRAIVFLIVTSLVDGQSPSLLLPKERKNLHRYTKLSLLFHLRGTISQFMYTRSEINEDVFTARNCETTHWMIISKFFLSLT